MLGPVQTVHLAVNTIRPGAVHATTPETVTRTVMVIERSGSGARSDTTAATIIIEAVGAVARVLKAVVGAVLLLS